MCQVPSWILSREQITHYLSNNLQVGDVENRQSERLRPLSQISVAYPASSVCVLAKFLWHQVPTVVPHHPGYLQDLSQLFVSHLVLNSFF